MRRILAPALALLLCLTSCAAMLEREYTVSVAHEENPAPRGDTAYRVETYTALRSALLSYVEEGMEKGLLRFPTTYAGNLTVDLEKARRQLLEEEPLGCYALEEVTFHTSKIIAYYEVELTFAYRPEWSPGTTLPRVSSREALTTHLIRALEAGEGELCVYLTAYPDDQPDFFRDALADAWAALSAPEEEQEPPAEEAAPEPSPEGEEAEPQDPLGLRVTLYPEEGGARRVAQLEFSPWTPENDHG